MSGMGSITELHAKRAVDNFRLANVHLRQSSEALRRGNCRAAMRYLRWASADQGAAQAHADAMEGHAHWVHRSIDQLTLLLRSHEHRLERCWLRRR